MEKNKTNEENKIEKSESNINQDDETFLLFIQLIIYYNFQRKMDKVLELGYPFLEEKNSINSPMNNEETHKSITEKYKQNKFCLINKSWINRWKKFIGYSEIVKLLNKNHFKIENYNEEVKNIIKRYSYGNRLLPLKMYDIYKDDKTLDIYSNFDIIDLNVFMELIKDDLKKNQN